MVDLILVPNDGLFVELDLGLADGLERVFIF
jgi:hypothetical protein